MAQTFESPEHLSDASPFIRVSRSGANSVPSAPPEPRIMRTPRSVSIAVEDPVDSPEASEYFAEESVATRPRARTMPKRLSEEAREIVEAQRRAPEEAFEEDPISTPQPKRKRSSRKKKAESEAEQIALPLKQPRAKQDSLVKQRQVLGFACVVMAVMVFIALVSYTADDASVAETKVRDLPALFFTPDQPTPAQELVRANADRAHNGLRLIGAMLADFLINKTIGYASIIFPFFFGWWSLAFFRFTYKQRQRLTLATTFFLVTAVLFSATLGTASTFFPIAREWSGAVGQYLGLAFTRLIGGAGAFIAYASAFIITLVFSIDLDIEKTFLRLKGYWNVLVLFSRRKLIEFWDKREARKEERASLREEEAARDAEEEAAASAAAEVDTDGADEGLVSLLPRRKSKKLAAAVAASAPAIASEAEAAVADPLQIDPVPEANVEEPEIEVKKPEIPRMRPQPGASPALRQKDEAVAKREEAVAEPASVKPTADSVARDVAVAAVAAAAPAIAPAAAQVVPGQPLLKVRPAPKAENGAIPRMTRANDRLGQRSVSFTRLSNGEAEPEMEKPPVVPAIPGVAHPKTLAVAEPAAVSPSVSREMASADPTAEEISNVDLRDEIVTPVARPRRPASELSVHHDPEVELGTEKALADEALPHSVSSEEYRDVVREHQSLARQAARDVDAARKTPAESEDLFYEEGKKPVIPENPYNEILIKYKNPPLDILTPADPKDALDANDEELKMKGRLLRDKLATFGVDIENITVTPGPVVTLYEFTPAEGVKVSRVENLTDDIALAMKARGIRIIAPIPGRGTIGVEIPNDVPKMVRIRPLFESESFRNTKMNLPLALGKTISGDVYVDDLNKMPHLLIAGATGSGKSVGVNGIIASLLYAKSPRDVKFVIVDPKKIELSLYKKLRKHYLIVSPEAGEDIVTTPQFAVLALKAVELEMERRYDKLAKAAVRSLADYNIKVAQGKLRSTQEEQHYHLPYIVVIIDELADLMITAAREIEEPICRIAQMARAVGIHLILATQRPSVDVITGVIKANFPARMAYQVATRVDSRTILDSMGAEQLLGNGDMLYQPSGTPKAIRLQSPFISTDEVEAMIESIAMQDGDKMSYSRPWTLPSLKSKDSRGGSTMEDENTRDELFEEAARVIVRHQQGSVSLLQRRLKVGYSRAARIVDELEQAAIVGPFDGSKARQVLCENEEELELVLEGLR